MSLTKDNCCKQLIGIILRELDRQRNQEPIFQEVSFPELGDIGIDGWAEFHGLLNVHQLADAIYKGVPDYV